MIPYLAYACVCVFLIILKSAVLSQFALFHHIFDILLPIVLYLGLFRPFVQGLPLVFFYGFCMDSMTGGPFGIYVFVYFLLFVAMRWVIQFVHARSILLKPLAVLAGVLVENVIIIGILALLYRERLAWGTLLHSASIQLIWAALAGPPALILIDWVQTRSSNWFDEWLFQRQESQS